MPCCRKSNSDGDQDRNGVISGPHTSHKEGSTPVIKIFTERIQSRKINPSKVAIQCRNSCLTYAQLNCFASCLARAVDARLGYAYMKNPDGDLVIAICLPMSDKCLSLIFAVLKLGATYLPLDPQHPEGYLLAAIRIFKPALLVTDDNSSIFNKFEFDSFSKLCPVVSIEELWLDSEFSVKPDTQRKSMETAWEIEFLEESFKTRDNPVVIMQSVSAKGQLYGVRIGSKSILNLVTYHWSRFKMTEKDVCVITVPISSPGSIPQLFIPLLLGCTLNAFRRIDLNNMAAFIKSLVFRKVTRLSFPTHCLSPFLEHLSPEIIKCIKFLKYVICRGSIVPDTEVQSFFELFKGVGLCNCMGGLETTAEIGFEIFESSKDYSVKLHHDKLTLGTVMSNVKVYVVNFSKVTKEATLAEDGHSGWICVSGDCLAIGYSCGTSRCGKAKFLENPFFDGEPPFDRLYKSSQTGTIIHKTRRLYLDAKPADLAAMLDGGVSYIAARKW